MRQTGIVTLHDHQEDAVKRMHDGCVLMGGVGSGKTYTSLQYYLDNHSDKDLLVITTAKKRDSFDWMKEARDMHILTDRITVDSWNNITRYEYIEDFFVIFDEQRLVGTGAWTKSFWKMARSNKWILLSGTPGDTWSDYAPVFIANGFYQNITHFRREHAVYSRFSKFPKIERYVDEDILEHFKERVFVTMDVERHTTRHMKTVKVPYDVEKFGKVWKKRWNIYEDKPLRDAGELFRVARKLVGSDPRRVESLKRLTKVHDKLIVFYNFDYELEMLREMCGELEEEWNSPAGVTTARKSEHSGSIRLARSGTPQKEPHSPMRFTFAEWNGHKHQEIPETDRWVYLVQYSSGSEGWNCVETDAMVFYSLTYSYKQFEQAQGRIDRMNTPFIDLYYYVLMSDSLSCKAVWRSLTRKKNFNTRGFRVKKAA